MSRPAHYRTFFHSPVGITAMILRGWRDRTQSRSAPVLGRSHVKSRISLGKHVRLLAVGAGCARGRARSAVLYPAFLAVKKGQFLAYQPFVSPQFISIHFIPWKGRLGRYAGKNIVHF